MAQPKPKVIKCKVCNGLSLLLGNGCQGCGGTGVFKKKHHNHNHHKKPKSGRNFKFGGAIYYKPKRHKYPCHGRKVLRLYHQTDKNGANAIRNGGKMIRGSQGMFGGGIYFAKTKADTQGKAHHKGYMIIADVFVGKELIVLNGLAGQFTFNSLYKKGYDSVYAPKGSGNGKPERVVYNYDQVRIIKVYKM